MKKVILFSLLAFSLTIRAAEAQVAHFVQWDPNPISDLVTSYTVILDSNTGASVGPTVDSTCGCIQWQLPTLTAGNHTVTLTATNSWGTSTPTIVTFSANAAGKVVNVRIK